MNARKLAELVRIADLRILAARMRERTGPSLSATSKRF